MTTRLDPPTVPPLTTAERSRLRNQVMDRTRPTTHRPATRWIAPMVGVGAVAAVAAGTLVVTNRPPADPGVAGPATAATPTAARSSLEVVPDAEAAAAYEKSCEDRMHRVLERPLTIRWARRVPGQKGTNILMIVKGSGKSGIASCLAPGGGGVYQQDALAGRWNNPPTQKEGLAGLTSGNSSEEAPKPASRMWTLYRARPEIARIESRMVWNGIASPWQRGYVDSGYAYADNRVDAVANARTVRQEVRAYDAQDRLLPIQPK
ncbi:hypothetical protein AB0L70_06560 [Kribbella sp. NPDC051952]|uniref:hypothetical protein n=1 Tax=Kribbella sp. NPDC051952 TaxID=3154851 RepID=UPI00343DEB83